VEKYAKIRKWMGKLAGAILSLAVLAGLYFTLVIAQPQGDNAVPSEPAAALTSSASQRIDSETELRDLVRAFPGPVMSFMSGSGMVFVSGTAEDSVQGGIRGRVLTLYWQTREGEPLILRSIWPAEAVEILGKEDYIFSAAEGPVLFGMRSVRMENKDTVRVHVQAEGQGIYAIVLPRSLAAELSGISRSVQLFTAD